MENQPSISTQISTIKNMLDSGYGRTGKLLPQKRIKQLQQKLKELTNK